MSQKVAQECPAHSWTMKSERGGGGRSSVGEAWRRGRDHKGSMSGGVTVHMTTKSPDKWWDIHARKQKRIVFTFALSSLALHMTVL